MLVFHSHNLISLRKQHWHRVSHVDQRREAVIVLVDAKLGHAVLVAEEAAELPHITAYVLYLRVFDYDLAFVHIVCLPNDFLRANFALNLNVLVVLKNGRMLLPAGGL